jgi:hypothetical protein
MSKNSTRVVIHIAPPLLKHQKTRLLEEISRLLDYAREQEVHQIAVEIVYDDVADPQREIEVRWRCPSL